jgi:NAD(P)-dependent dehydrogenase (short-subunit alcohol dehydrogenase family)
VRALAREGAHVIIHGRTAENAEAVAADIGKESGAADIVLGALDDPADVDRIAQDALALGPIDILINCAGAGSSTRRWFDVPLERWLQQYQFSTMYAVQLIRAIVPQMRERGWGRVLNVSSAAAFKPNAYGPEYAAAKLSLQSIAVSLASELEDCGVTVNTLTSGLVLTDGAMRTIRARAAERGFTETGDALERRVTRDLFRIPLGRAGKLEELASAACYLVSEPAGFITGASLRVDGGSSAFVN